MEKKTEQKLLEYEQIETIEQASKEIHELKRKVNLLMEHSVVRWQLKDVEELKVEEKVNSLREKYGLPRDWMFDTNKLSEMWLKEDEIEVMIEYEKILHSKKK